MKTEWIKSSEHLPQRKEGWNHSEKVLVYYEGNEHNIEEYGIAYYNYDPPYANPGFTDFAHYGRQPTLWTPIEHPKIGEERDKKAHAENKAWDDWKDSLVKDKP